MTINRAALRSQLEPGLNAIFGLAYKQYPDEGRMIYELATSQRAFEEDQMMATFDNAHQKDEGDSVRFDDTQETFKARYEHLTYALAFEITEEAIEDNLYEQMGNRYAKELARSMAHTKNIEGAAILNFAFTAGVRAGGDGVALCSASHPTLTGGNRANVFSVGTDLNETALEEAVIAITDYRDERGKRIAANATRLIIPTDLQFVAHRILKSTLRSGTTDNDANAMRDMGIFSQDAAVMRFLTDPDAWFVKTDCPNGLKRFDRVKLQTKMAEPEFNTGNLRYKVRERYSHGFSDWRCIHGSQGAG